jgi:hypothetical protein
MEIKVFKGDDYSMQQLIKIFEMLFYQVLP